ncbi:MAG: hypothetical protein M3X11_15625, partial [Acidobacteriota bacterium]|nr:hypothetical protein [Acidobacteriota bacterium]
MKNQKAKGKRQKAKILLNIVLIFTMVVPTALGQDNPQSASSQSGRTPQSSNPQSDRRIGVD